MNYIRLVSIFTCLCLWHSGNAAPFISIQSNSRSSSQQMLGGQLRTIYDFSSQDTANDLTGKMVYSRLKNFRSDFPFQVLQLQ